MIEIKGSKLNSQVRKVEPDPIGFHKMKIRNRLTSLSNLNNKKGPALYNCIVQGNTLTNFDPFPELCLRYVTGRFNIKCRRQRID